MSKNDNSSITHVAPAFDAISANPKAVMHFLEILNKRIKNHTKIPVHGIDAKQIQWYYNSKRYNRKEIKRRSPVSFLQYLLDHNELINCSQLETIRDKIKIDARKKAFQTSEAKKDAFANLEIQYRFGLPGKSLYAIEGNSQPDVCLKTNKFILLIEGKHTENKLTANTNWIKNRDQLVRHIDSFLDNSDGEFGASLPVFGIEIVSNTDYDFHIYEDDSNFDIWLPHRSPELRKFVKENCIIPHMTWGELLAAFDGIATWTYGEKSTASKT